VVVFLSCKSDTLLYLHRVQECAHIAFCENRLNIFCADHIIACTHGLLHTSALKDFADQPGVGEVFIFITKDYFCSAGILKLISCQNGLKKSGSLTLISESSVESFFAAAYFLNYPERDRAAMNKTLIVESPEEWNNLIIKRINSFFDSEELFRRIPAHQITKSDHCGACTCPAFNSSTKFCDESQLFLH